MRRAAAIGSFIVAALLALAAPASGQTLPVCVYQPPAPEPTQAEKELAELKGYAAERKQFGFRSDLAYVRKLIKAGQWESDVGFIPVTKREDEYLQLRDSLTLGNAGNRYLRPRRDQYGGASIEDGWPRAPYLLVRFTKDVKRHLAALKRVARFPDNLRAKRVRYSERTLDRARNRVSDDFKQLAKAGFHIQISSYDTDKGVAEIELVTKRTDTKAYFAKRYGKLVKPIVTGTETTVLECAPSTAFKIEPDGLSIRPRYESGGGAEYERTEVTEFPDRVEIGVVERASTGARTLDLPIGYAPPTTLSAPLGDRAVIDTRTGKRLPLRGPAPGDPPCPPRPEETGAAPDLPSYAYDLEVDPKVEAYVRKHDADYGGSVLEGTRTKAYLTYGFVRNRARHEREIKRLTRHRGQVRVIDVQFLETDLERLATQITEDARAADGFLDGYGRAGFAVQACHRSLAARGGPPVHHAPGSRGVVHRTVRSCGAHGAGRRPLRVRQRL